MKKCNYDSGMVNRNRQIGEENGTIESLDSENVLLETVINLRASFSMRLKIDKSSGHSFTKGPVVNQLFMERARHSFLLCPIPLLCLVMNKICLNQTNCSLQLLVVNTRSCATRVWISLPFSKAYNPILIEEKMLKCDCRSR